MSNKKLVSFRLPDDLMNTLKEKADHDNTSVTELVCRFLWQGLKEEASQPAADRRITSLEAEVQDLRQAKHPVTPPPLYALLTQSSIAHDSTIEMGARLSRLEQMMETLLRQNSPNSSLATASDTHVPKSSSVSAR
jgi:hypothetical protein